LPSLFQTRDVIVLAEHVLTNWSADSLRTPRAELALAAG
jgi:hypothetical protein